MAGVVPLVPRMKFTDSTGTPIAGGSVTVYIAGTTTLASTYQDSGLSTANTNPVTLDANGEALFWVSPANNYKFLLKDADGATVTGWPVDNIPGASGDAGLRDDLAADDGADLVSWQRSGTGPVIRTINSKLGDFLTMGDFINANAFDGVSDYTDDFQEAVEWVKTRNYGGKLILPPGTCPLSATIPLDISGLHLMGEGSDEGRTTWGKWPTRLKWIGSTSDNMLEIDSGLTQVIRGGTIEGMVIDAQDTSGVNPLYANEGSAHWRLKNICFRNYGTGSSTVYLDTSCFGWIFDDVELFNVQYIGMTLEGLCHHATFNRLRGAGTTVTAATSLVRIGVSDRCSSIQFNDCDFSLENSTYQVELLNARAVQVSGGYSEAFGTGLTAVFRLGVTGTTSCDGFNLDGFYTQGNDLYAYAVDIKKAAGVCIGGGNHFRNLTTAVVDANVACENSRFGAGNYLEDVGGTGSKVKFDSLSTGWSFSDDGTSNPTITGTGGSANTYTLQRCKWQVRDGRCHADIEVKLSALNVTGALSIDTGIPYTSVATYECSCAIGHYSGFTLAAGSSLKGFLAPGTNDITLYEQVNTGSGWTTVLDTEASASAWVVLSVSFPISPGS